MVRATIIISIVASAGLSNDLHPLVYESGLQSWQLRMMSQNNLRCRHSIFKAMCVYPVYILVAIPP